MATPRKNASKAEQLRVSQIGDFKARMGGIQELPSGLVVKVRNPGGLTAFIANGSIPNSLLGIVKTTLDKNMSKEEMVKAASGMADDLESIGDIMNLMNIIAAQVVIEPTCRMVPTEADVERFNLLNPDNQVSTPNELRSDDVLYVDEIDEMDKQFLFQWVTGGTRDLEKFRREYQASLVAVSPEQGPAAIPSSNDGTNNG